MSARTALGAALAALAFCGTAAALDQPQKQVLIEPTLVYFTLDKRDFGIDFAFVLTPKGADTLVEVSTLAHGRGADFRRWLPERPELLSETGGVIQPQSVEKFYVPKSSVASGVAPFIFGAIGSQYVGRAGHAAASPGTACSASGAQGEEHSGISQGIDRVGMAAGMGLLTSQAKGELQGQRSSFLLKNTPVLGLTLRTAVRHKDRNDLVIVITPEIIRPEN